MRIALLSDGVFPFVNGGMQVHSYQFCLALLQQGCKVDLFHCLPKSKNIVSWPDAIQKYINKELRIHTVEFPVSIKFPGHYLYNSFRFSKNIHKQLKPLLNDVDLIYAQGLTAWHLLLNREDIKPPVYVNLHGFNMYQKSYSFKEKFQNALFKRITNKILLKTDRIVLLDDSLKLLLKDLAIDKNKFIIHPNAISDFWFEFPNKERNELNLVFIGRDHPVKGLKFLAAALNSLDIEIKNKLKLTLLGPENFPYEHNYMVECLPFVNDPNIVRKILDESSGLIISSLSEGFPTVMLEAMARFCPVVTTRVGAIPAIAGNFVYLCEPANADSLKNAILSLYRDLNSNKYFSMTEQAFSIAQQYSWSAQTRAFLQKL